MLAAIDSIESIVINLDQTGFAADPRSVKAVAYDLLVIGEADKHLAEGVEIRQPDIPWRDIRAMRDRLVHEYRELDPDIVWFTANDDLAPLRAALLVEQGWLKTLKLSP